MSFWTLRHPPIDRGGRCIGQTECMPTIPIQEALQRALANPPIQPRQLYSSDQPRCSQLAQAMAKELGLHVERSPALREMNFGEWEGVHYDDLDREDRERWRTWCADWMHETPPGGESLAQFSERVKSWLLDKQPAEGSVVVTHAGVIRVFQVIGGVTWEQAMATQHPFLGWTQFHTVTK